MTKQVPPNDASKNSKSTSSLMWVAIYGLPLIAVAAFFALRPVQQLPENHDEDSIPLSGRDRMVNVGGVSRPMSDISNSGKDGQDDGVAPQDDSQDDQLMVRQLAQTGHKVTASNEWDLPAGVVTLKKGMNSMVDGVVEAIEGKSHPERLSPTVVPAKFDPEAYQADPSVFLSLAEPGRVWQTVQPAKGVNPLIPIGSTNQTLHQGESVRLVVRAEPGSPVTFTSFDSGVFENQLPSQTVAADDKGQAVAVYTASTGTVASVNVLAGGALNSGQVQFRLFIPIPE